MLAPPGGSPTSGKSWIRPYTTASHGRSPYTYLFASDLHFKTGNNIVTTFVYRLQEMEVVTKSN